MSFQRFKLPILFSAVILVIVLAGYIRWLTRDPGIHLSPPEGPGQGKKLSENRALKDWELDSTKPLPGSLRPKGRSARSSGRMPAESAAGWRNGHGSSELRDRAGILPGIFGRQGLPRGMSRDDIPREFANDPEGFLDRLDEVRQEDLDEQEKEELDQIFFTTAFPDLFNGPPFYTDAFSPYSGRIYGAFNSGTANLQGRDRVLVKWTGAQGDILLYEYMAIQRDTPFNYVWLEEGFWDEGTYVLALYGLEDDIRALAYGSFLVENLPVFIGHLELCEEPDQGAAQTDFAFSSRIILRFEYASQEDRPVALAVYKMETGEYIIDENVLLPAADSGTFSRVIKEPGDVYFPFGTFAVEVWTERDFPEGRVVFVHHE